MAQPATTLNIPPHVSSILSTFGVYSASISEVHYQPLYSLLTYPVAGAQSFSFFTSGSTPSTLNKTNLPGNGGTLPKPVNFLILSVELIFKSGATPGVIGASGTTAADDYAAVMDSANGYFELKFGQKPYIQMSPLSAIPEVTAPDFHLALADTAAATLGAATPSRERFGITPILWASMEQMYATINYPGGAVAAPTGKAGTIGVKLNGYLYSLVS